MATNEPINAPVNEVPQFDCVATQIMNAYNLLIDQLIARRDALLRKLREMKDDYLSKETIRKAAMEELTRTQQHMEELSLKVNENKYLHQQATDLYQQGIQQLETPTKLLQPFFSCPTLYKLETQIAEFGEVKECVDYSLKKEPVLAVGKRGKGNNELDAGGLSLDEPNQLIYIADCENSRIQVVSFEGNFLASFGSTILSGPCNVAVTDDFVFVTDRYLNALLKFSKKDYKFVRRTGTEGAREGELNQPYGLCIDYNRDVYVAHSTRVSIFSQGLTLLNCLGTQQLYFPRDVKVTPNSIVVLDTSPNCIHFYSRSGDLISSCVSKGYSGIVCEPYFFCLDAAGNILITDTDRHNIKILSPSGQLIHTIGREGHGKGEFECPWGIRISESGTIFVISNHPNFCLQSF